MSNKVFYYDDELNDEFSSAKIDPILIDNHYKYFHNKLWDFFSFILQNILSMPIKVIYAKQKFNLKFIGKEKFKECRKSGYFIYANHTQEFADTFIPSLANYPKRNFFIVNPENVSMRGLKQLVPLLGAIPIPATIKSWKNFLSLIMHLINKNYSITIYPEAHIWPFYTKIRPFKDISFKYPVTLNVPVFAITNTYHKGGRDGKVNIISYIDGPFYPNKEISNKKAQNALRNKVYEIMCQRAQNSTYEHIKYLKREDN